MGQKVKQQVVPQGHLEGLEGKLMGRRLKFIQLIYPYFHTSCVLKTKLLIE